MWVFKLFLGIGGLVFIGVAGWQIGGRLSSDAIGMALGVLFGIMAGIPASLMVLAARRHDDSLDCGERRDADYWQREYWRLRQAPPLWQEQSPVVEQPQRRRQPQRLSEESCLLQAQPSVILLNNLTLDNDPRLTPLNQTTPEGYHLMEVSESMRLSSLVRTYPAYEIKRFGAYVGVRPRMAEAVRQIAGPVDQRHQ